MTVTSFLNTFSADSVHEIGYVLFLHSCLPAAHKTIINMRKYVIALYTKIKLLTIIIRVTETSTC